MKIFSLKTCDSCRKAIRDLKNAGKNPEIIDIRTDGIDPKDLMRFLTEFGDPMINRRSTTWRLLLDSQRKQPVLKLLQEHPTLMKRPIIDADGQLFLGWNEEVQRVLIG